MAYSKFRMKFVNIPIKFLAGESLRVLVRFVVLMFSISILIQKDRMGKQDGTRVVFNPES